MARLTEQSVEHLESEQTNKSRQPNPSTSNSETGSPDAIRQTRPPPETAAQTPHGPEGTRQLTHHERFAPETQGRDPSDRPRPAERGGQTDSRPSAAADDSHWGGAFQQAPTVESWHSARAANGWKTFVAVDRPAPLSVVRCRRRDFRAWVTRCVVGDPIRVRVERGWLGFGRSGLDSSSETGGPGGGRQTILAGYLLHQ